MKKVAIILGFIFWAACQSSLPNKEATIDTFYQLKVEELLDQKDQECKREIYSEAKTALDSIVHKLLNADLMDTIDFPDKPVKPTKPKHVIGTVDKFELPDK